MFKMQIFIADFETTPFQDKAISNYLLHPLFINVEEFYSGKFQTFILTDKNVNKIVQEKIYEGTYNSEDDFTKFLRKCCSMRNTSYIYFHNLKFDFKFFENHLPREFGYEIVEKNGNFYEIKFFKEYRIFDKRKNDFRIQRKYVLHLRDSLKLLLVSVDEIGKSLKFPKGKVNYDCEISEEFIEYGKQDCRIVRKALWNLVQFVKENFGMSEFCIEKMPLTLPSLAKKVWEYLLRQEYGEDAHILVFDQFATDYEDFFRKYYFGGRVEVFDFSEQFNKAYNDVNSYYPSIMHNYQFPLPPYRFQKVDEWDFEIGEILKDKSVFAVFGEINEQQPIPLCPVRMESGKIMYPIGHKTVFLFREEFEYLTQVCKQSVKVKQILYCSDWGYIFKDFVELTYFKRKEEKDKGKKGNQFLIYLLKIFQNALYGKFAENKLKDSLEFFTIDAFQALPEEKHQMLLDSGKCEIVEYGEEEYMLIRDKKLHKVDINIFYAMRITALCRLDLHQKMVKMQDLSYVDTDSLVGEKIEDSNELGHLKVEFYADKFQALGCKEYAYCVKEKVLTVMNCNFYVENINAKMKGFGRVKYEQFEQFVIQYLKPKRQWRPAGFLEVINRGLQPNEIIVFDKEKSAFYDKRWIMSDLTTVPFNIDCENLEELIKNNQKMIRRIIQRYKEV